MISRPRNILAIIIGVLLGISSCCTKKDCLDTIYPDLYVRFNDADDNDDFWITVTQLDKKTNDVVDSFISYSQKTAFLEIFYQDRKKEALDYNYKITGPFNNSDTIFGMTYNKNLDKIHCNTCFLGDGRADVLTYSNFRCHHRSSIYKSGDTIVLSR